MLILSRRTGESLTIRGGKDAPFSLTEDGGDIVVTVFRTTAGVVRLGIDAPQDVEIVRSELLDQETKGKHHAKDSNTAETPGTGSTPVEADGERQAAVGSRVV